MTYTKPMGARHPAGPACHYSNRAGNAPANSLPSRVSQTARSRRNARWQAGCEKPATYSPQS